MLRSLTFCAAALAGCLAVAASAAVGTSSPKGLSEANVAAQARMDAFQARQQAAAERVIRSICIGCLPGAAPARGAGAKPAGAVAAAPLRRTKAVAARRPETDPGRGRRPVALRALKRVLLARLMLPDDGE